MNSSIFLDFTVISLILVSIHYAQGSNLRDKRMTDPQVDTNDIFKHEALLTIKKVMNEKKICSGTIISNKFILTTASCIIQEGTDYVDPNDVIEVKVGMKQINNTFEFHVVRLVQTAYVPKLYSYNSFKTEENLKNTFADIAVLKLNHDLGLGRDPRIKELKLPTHNFEEEQSNGENSIIFTGFGINKVDYPLYLQYSKAQVLPQYHCELERAIAKYKMCAKMLHDTGVCTGDNGGALFDFNTKTIVGVLSYANKECNAKMPGVYTRVFAYKDFILNAINNITDKMEVTSFAEFPNYKNVLNRNPWKYHWIYPANSAAYQNLVINVWNKLNSA